MRDFRADHTTIAGGREGVAVVPPRGIDLTPCIKLARFERLERDILIADINMGDLIEIVEPLRDRQIFCPPIGIAQIADLPPRHGLTNHVRP